MLSAKSGATVSSTSRKVVVQLDCVSVQLHTMQRSLRIGAAVFVAIVIAAPWAFAESVAKARLLFANKLYIDAKREAVAVVFSDATDAEKAEALNLLGEIAVDEHDYVAAVENWSELVAKFPSTPAAAEAIAKLPLAKRLAERTPEELPAKEDSAGAVLIAGVAPEHPQYADQAVLEFMNFLASKRVKVTNSFTGRLSDATAGRVAEVSLPNLLANAREVRAASVLFVYIHFRGMENMRVECYAPDGKKLWQEKASASLGMSPSGMTEGFVRRMKGKLEKHVGDVCFPVSVPK
jgi:hypothetical protein